jgi:hypothetical protein
MENRTSDVRELDAMIEQVTARLADLARESLLSAREIEELHALRTQVSGLRTLPG